MPGQLGPMRRVLLRIDNGSDAHHVDHWNAFGDADDQGDFGVGGFENGVSGVGRRHKNHRGICAGAFDRFSDGVEHRAFEMLGAAFAGRYAADDIGAVFDHLLGVESSFAAGEALHDQFVFFVDQDAHCAPPARATTFCAPSFIPFGDGEVEAGFTQDLLAEFDVGAFHANDDRNFHLKILRGGDDAGGQNVAAENAAKNVDEHGFDAGVTQAECGRRF